MKKTIIVAFLLLLFPLIGWGQYITLEYDYEPTHETVKYECAFCGKDIFEQVEIIKDGESDYYWGGGLVYMPNQHDWFIVTIDTSQVQYIAINHNLKVCRKCSDKYDKEITEIMSGTWDKLMKSILNEKTNVNLRKYHNLKRRKEKIDQLEKKIEEYKFKKKEVEKEIKYFKKNNEDDEWAIWGDWDTGFTVMWEDENGDHWMREDFEPPYNLTEWRIYNRNLLPIKEK